MTRSDGRATISEFVDVQGGPSAQATSDQRSAGKRYRARKKWREWGWCYLFLLPFLVFFTAFTLWPIVATIGWSFTDFHVPSTSLEFIGLANFRMLLRDDLFIRSFVNTILFALGNTAIKLPLSLLLAVFLTRKWVAGKGFFRTVYFLPIVVPTAIAGLVFALLLHPLNGAVPQVLRDLGWIGARDNLFLGSRFSAMSTIILVSVWQILGQYLIYWIAALQGVPSELSDAAHIDGAGFWQELFFVTLPAIRPVATIIAFLALVNAFSVFGIVLTLTGGGPGTQSFVMQLFVYERAFTEVPFRYGYISAGAVLFSLLILIVFVLQSVTVRRAQAQLGGR